MTATPRTPNIVSISNPDAIQDPGPRRIEGMPEILQLEKLDELAGVYRDMAANPSYMTENGPDFTKIEEIIAGVKKNLLQDAGFVTDEVGRTDEQKQAYEFADTVLDRAIRSSKQDWKGYTTPDGGHDGLSRRVFRELHNRYYKSGEAVDHAGGEKEEEPPEEPLKLDKLSLAERHENQQIMIALRREYAERLAERSKSMFERSRTGRAIVENREELADMIGATATQMYEDGIERGLSHDALVEQIDEFIRSQTDQLLTDMQIAREESAARHNRFVRWGIEKWAALGGADSMNLPLKEKIKTKGFWARTAILGGVSVLVGGVAAFGVGVAGAGAAAAFGASLLARSIARNVASVKLDGAANAQTIAASQNEQYREEITDKWDDSQHATEAKDRVSHDDLLEYIDNQTGLLRKANNKKLMGSIGVGVAFGLMGGGVMRVLAPELVPVFGAVGRYIQEHYGSPAGSTTSTASDVQTPGGDSGAKPPVDSAEPEQNPDNGRTKVELIKDYLSEHAAAGKIRSGEGWYQTFKELGVKSKNWDELLQEVGPKLHDIRYEGVRAAYWDENADEWRINMTENGKMSPKALKLIVEHANENGYLKNPIEFDDATGVMPEFNEDGAAYAPGSGADHDGDGYADGVFKQEAVDYGAAAETISNGESWAQTIHELQRSGLVQAELEPGAVRAILREAGPKLALIKYSNDVPVAYKYGGEWRMNMSPDGEMSLKALAILRKVANRSEYALGA